MRFVVALVVVAAALGSACQDPCVTLAQRICDCELTSGERSQCRTERVVNQQSNIKISDADRGVCDSKLKTCTCDALDKNNLDACGFMPEGGEGEGAGQ